MAKRRVESQVAKFDSWPLKVRNRPDFLACRWRAIIVEKFSTRAITFLQTSSRSEVCTQSYSPSKSRESWLWEFRDSNLGVPGQNDIWVLVPWPGTKYTIRGEGGGFPQVWAVMSLVSPNCSWFVLAPKMF
jgi:hypothetical protein